MQDNDMNKDECIHHGEIVPELDVSCLGNIVRPYKLS
jgi:hypothetical protein